MSDATAYVANRNRYDSFLAVNCSVSYSASYWFLGECFCYSFVVKQNFETHLFYEIFLSQIFFN